VNEEMTEVSPVKQRKAQRPRPGCCIKHIAGYCHLANSAETEFNSPRLSDFYASLGWPEA